MVSSLSNGKQAQTNSPVRTPAVRGMLSIEQGASSDSRPVSGAAIGITAGDRKAACSGHVIGFHRLLSRHEVQDAIMLYQQYVINHTDSLVWGV